MAVTGVNVLSQMLWHAVQTYAVSIVHLASRMVCYSDNSSDIFLRKHGIVKITFINYFYLAFDNYYVL